MKTILIATDGTEPAQHAVHVGLELAADENASVTFVHATTLADLVEGMEDPKGPPNRVPVPEEDAVLHSALGLARDRGIAAQAELLLGYVPAQIARLADDIDADMIVVGSRSLGPLKRAVLGGVSRPLLGMTRRPVLIVQEPAVREPSAP
jgi:nucleotide-binding universal stress UspA family protein